MVITMKKKTIVALSAVFILILSVLMILLFYRHKPFKSLSTDDIDAVTVYENHIPDEDHPLSNEKVHEFLSALCEISTPIFSDKNADIYGVYENSFRIKLKDGKIYDIGAGTDVFGDCYFAVNNEFFKAADCDMEYINIILMLHGRETVY